MTSQDNYDKINRTIDGDYVFFGGHYEIQEARDIMRKEEYFDDEEIMKFNKVEFIWLHFGFITNEGEELTNGWKCLDEEPKDKRGCIKATIVK